MTQRDRDRLVVLKKAQKGLITQRQAATELDLTERHVRRLLRRLKARGDASVIPRFAWTAVQPQAERRDPRESGPDRVQGLFRFRADPGLRLSRAETPAADRSGSLAASHDSSGIMASSQAKSGKGSPVESSPKLPRRAGAMGHQRARLAGGPGREVVPDRDDRRCQQRTVGAFCAARLHRGEHAATVELFGKEWSAAAFYTDKASLFQTAPKVARDVKTLPRDEREPLPPTQIGRALRELGIVWIPAHSPQAKGRIERSFGTAQDRLVKGLRIAGASTLEQANRYLEQEFLPWWNQHLVVAPANATDAHRPLGAEHDLSSALSQVNTRQVASDYTIRLEGKMYRIARADVTTGLRGGTVRVESRLDGTLAVRFRERYVAVSLCTEAERAQSQASQPRPSFENTQR